MASFHHVSKNRWEKDWRIAAFIVLFDFIQSALFIVDPLFKWNINWEGCVG